MVLYHGPSDAQQNKNQSPEDQKKGMEAWNTWAKGMGNQLVDMGAPLQSGQGFSKAGNLSGFQSDVTGYSFIQAENLEKAQALLRNHPHLQNDQYSIELREAAEMPTDWSQRNESGATRERDERDVRNAGEEREFRGERERDVRSESQNLGSNRDENRDQDRDEDLNRRRDENQENRNINR